MEAAFLGEASEGIVTKARGFSGFKFATILTADAKGGKKKKSNKHAGAQQQVFTAYTVWEDKAAFLAYQADAGSKATIASAVPKTPCEQKFFEGKLVLTTPKGA